MASQFGLFDTLREAAECTTPPLSNTLANLAIKTTWRLSMLETSAIFVTGGCGTFGHALARRRKRDGWTGKLTVYSTDGLKHERMRREYPDINFIQGDIRNSETLYMAMVGHDVVIHAAAAKVIPIAEYNSIDTIETNVNGTINVCACALRADIPHVIALSTDKAAHPVNCYGATKYLTEKIFQEYSRLGFPTQFHLVRFGNVLESNGSVIEFWKKAVAKGETIKITNPSMTRFFLSPSQSVQYAIDALEYPAGCVYIPRMSALSIGRLAIYTVGDVPFERVPIRPGEKVHESLLTEEEGWYTIEFDNHFLLHPTTAPRYETAVPPYSSDMAPELTKEKLIQLLEEG